MNEKTLNLNLAKTFKTLGDKIGAAIKANGIDLPIEQFFVMELLFQHQNLILQEAAEILQKDKSGLLRTIDSLEKKKFITRVPDASDRRKKNIVPTKKGTEVFQQVVDIELKTISEVLSGISKEDKEVLNRCITSIQKNMN